MQEKRIYRLQIQLLLALIKKIFANFIKKNKISKLIIIIFFLFYFILFYFILFYFIIIIY